MKPLSLTFCLSKTERLLTNGERKSSTTRNNEAREGFFHIVCGMCQVVESKFEELDNSRRQDDLFTKLCLFSCNPKLQKWDLSHAPVQSISTMSFGTSTNW